MVPAGPPSPLNDRRRFLLPTVIALLTLAAFLPSLRGEFLNWDDDGNFTGNYHYRGLGLSQLRWMFTDYFGHYMPLTWLTLGLDYTLWGMNPAGYHATNVALHALNAVLLFYLLLALAHRARPDLDGARIALPAALGALFFSLHPLRVESVAWITERRDVLSGAFFLVSALCYVRASEDRPGPSQRGRWLALSAAAFAGLLLSKALGLTLPLVFLVLDVYPLGRFSRATAARLIWEKVPFLLLMLGGLAMVSVASAKADVLASREHYSLFQSIAQPGFRVSFYLGKSIVPVHLSPLYWYRPGAGAPQIIGWGVVLGVTAIATAARRRAPLGLAGWISFLLLIAPVSGIQQAGPHFAADRYTYLTCLPLAAWVTGAAVLALGRPAWRAGLGVAMAGVLLGFAFLSSRQCLIWRDSVALWTRAIELDPDVYFTRYYRGLAYAGRREWARALSDYSRSIELNGRWEAPWGGRAKVRLALGDPAGAVSDATRALEIKPGWGEALNTRGLARSRQGDLRGAIADLSAALDVRPQFVEARINRASDRAKLGDLPGALEDLDQAIQFDPQASIYLRRATLRGMRGDFEGVISDCSEALRQQPELLDGYVRRGLAYAARDRREEAAADFAQALERAPSTWPQRRQVEQFLRESRIRR